MIISDNLQQKVHILLNKSLNLVCHSFLAGLAKVYRDLISGLADFLCELRWRWHLNLIYCVRIHQSIHPFYALAHF